MSDGTLVLIACIAAIPGALAAIGAFVVGLRNGAKADTEAARLTGKADAIHVLVDGNLSDVKRELSEAKQSIAQLHATIVQIVGVVPPKGTP